MIRRCYADLENCSSYKDVIVCKEWHNFQNFAKWYEDNYYQFRDEIMQVDKDILKHGNKEYSPDIFISELCKFIDIGLVELNDFKPCR